MSEIQNILYGVNTVFEALNGGYSFSKILIKKQKTGNKIEDIIALCKEKKIQFFFSEAAEIDQLSPSTNHQGVIAFLKSTTRFILDLEHFVRENNPKVILVLDNITDQHNLGAITRSAFFFGVDLIMMEEKGSAPVDATVHKVSSGASLLIPFAIVPKISVGLEILKKNNIQLYATELSNVATSLSDTGFAFPIGIVLGSEGAGIRPHVKRFCSHEIMISGNSGFDSLNVSNACAVILYEIFRKREKNE